VLGSQDVLIVGHWLRLFYFIISLSLVLSVYYLARQYLASGYALLTAVIVQLYMYTYYLSDVLCADIPFALLTILFVMQNRHTTKPGHGVLSGLIAVSAYFLRTAGIALLAAWVAESF